MKKAVKVFSFLFISIAFLFLLVLLLVFFYVKRNIDFSSDEELFISSKNFESTVFYANSGTDGEYVPIISENTGSLKKSYALIDEIPESLKKGFIAVEDRRFYEHCGIDLKRTILAASNYLFKREKIFGASTITQQVIKNISGDNEIKLSRKFSEILRALHIEKCFGKDEILEVYLNIIPMSEEIYGAKEAAKCFFGKELSNLSVAQIATIIGVTNAPTAYNPYSNPDNCLKKRNSVLSVMFSEGVIGKNEYDKAMAEELSVIPKETREDRYDSWFTEAVIDSVSADLAKEKGISVNASRLLIVSGGYSIYTTMNPTVQKILEDYFSNLDNFPSQTNEGLNFAFTVLDSNNANLLGIIGRVGKKQANRLLNHALVPHTPASTLKPLSLYAPLIDEGKINYSTVLDDVPVEFYETEGEYRAYPRNSPDFYDGLLTIKDCLRLSKNTAAIRLCKLYGAKNSYNLLKNSFGFNSLVEKRVSSGKTYTDIATSPMALGQLTDGVSLLKLCQSYTVFPSDGRLNKVRNYLYVKDHRGNTVLENREESKEIFKKTTARIMNKLLSEVVKCGTAKSVTLKEKYSIAGKTGTSGNNKDKLFIGYSPYFTAGIWCGYDNGRSIEGLSKSHLKIWDEIMTKIHEQTGKQPEKKFSEEELLNLPYCKDSGQIYCEKCLYDPRGDRMEYGYFTSDNMPVEECNVHVLVNYDTVEKGVAIRGCPEENLVKIALIKVSRDFPCEVIVTDAEFAFKNLNLYSKVPTEKYPYFYDPQNTEKFYGITDRKKQFNSACQKHS